MSGLLGSTMPGQRQARACAVTGAVPPGAGPAVPAEQAADHRRLDVLWDWCLSAACRQAARDSSARPDHDLRFQMDALVAAMGPR